jgi:hypothetical protein
MLLPLPPGGTAPFYRSVGAGMIAAQATRAFRFAPLHAVFRKADVACWTLLDTQATTGTQAGIGIKITVGKQEPVEQRPKHIGL